MILQEFSGALILDKPAGASTHTPDSGVTDGFLEMAARCLEKNLWAVHRLDKETSGCLLVTTSSSSVESWTQKLTEGKKKYVFISPHESAQSVWSFEGRIEKIGNHRFGLVPGEPNSQTSFAKLGRCPLGWLYEAEITSGKTHQIRIHADRSQIPILGDGEHSGAPFVRLMLHAKELEIDGKKVVSPLPCLFEAQANEEIDLHKFRASLDRRRFLMSWDHQTNAWRLVHREWSEKSRPKLCVEKLGDVLHLLQYSQKKLDLYFVEKLAQLARCPHWLVRDMFNRGEGMADQNIERHSPDFPAQWTVLENKMKFNLRRSQGLSTGLFLDQRQNRREVLHTSQGKKVVNFFSYTCGFSLAAALGGAEEVVSVDTSAASLEWGRDNFELNGLDPDEYEFFVADSLFFLKSCQKRQRRFDLIILDPPTFSRSKHGVFQLGHNLPELLELSFLCLNSGGRILVTVNDETLSGQALGRMIESAVQKSTGNVVKLERCRPPYDFEFPLERDSVMKGFWVSSP